MNRLNHKNSLVRRVSTLLAVSAGSLALAAGVGGHEKTQAVAIESISPAAAGTNIDGLITSIECPKGTDRTIKIGAENGATVDLALSATPFKNGTAVGEPKAVNLKPNEALTGDRKLKYDITTFNKGVIRFIQQGTQNSQDQVVQCNEGDLTALPSTTSSSTSSSSTSTTLVSVTTTTHSQEVTTTTHAPATTTTNNTVATVTTIGSSPNTTVSTLGAPRIGSGQTEAIQKPDGTYNMFDITQAAINGQYSAANNAGKGVLERTG